MAIQRRPAAAAPVAAPAQTARKVVDLFNPDLYSGGEFIPEGDYAIFFKICMSAPTKKDGTKVSADALGTTITLYSLDPKNPDPKDGQRTRHLGMGAEAHLSFAASTDGYSLVELENPKKPTISTQSNHYLFFESLLNTGAQIDGFPIEEAGSNLKVIDGIWVHLKMVDEPVSRQNIGPAKVGLDGKPVERKPNKVPVVTDILEGGMPWAGGGGMPKGKTVPVAKPATSKVTPIAAQAQVAELVEEVADLEEHAINLVGEVLAMEAYAAGCTKTVMFKQISKIAEVAGNEETGSAVLDAYFGDDSTLNQLLNKLGYEFKGKLIKPVE